MMEKNNKNMPQKSSTKQSDEYDNPWTFNDKPFTTEQIEKFVGFCYVIECAIDGRKYIGRKYFYSRRKTKGKSRRVKSESNWKSYFLSFEKLLLPLATTPIFGPFICAKNVPHFFICSSGAAR